MNLKVIIERITEATKTNGFDEQDTIERLIVPIIKLSGWGIDSIDPFFLRRKNADTRSGHRRFDLELYIPGHKNPKFVFECKSIKEKIQLIGKGASNNTKDDSDFARQLRNYCLDENHLFERNWSVPILTNGCDWIIFSSTFTEVARKNENISEDNFEDFIVCKHRTPDQNFSEILKYLEYPPAESTH